MAGKSLFARMRELAGRDSDDTDNDMAIQYPGCSPESALVVKSLDEEYFYLSMFRVEPIKQALVEKDGKYFDLVTVKHGPWPETELWFDISAFYPGHKQV